MADTVRPWLRPVRALPWILGGQTLFWAAIVAFALARTRRAARGPAAWFLAVGLALAWIHAHTSPLYPVPRAFACLSPAWRWRWRRRALPARWSAACVVLAALAHPYNQAMNLAVALPAAAVLAGTPAAPALRHRAGAKLALVALGALALLRRRLALASPRGLSVVRILGEQPTGTWPRTGACRARSSSACPSAWDCRWWRSSTAIAAGAGRG